MIRKQQEAEKSESYETWLANKETEKERKVVTTVTQPQPQVITRQPEPEPVEKMPDSVKQEGYLRSYLRSLDERKRGNTYFCYESWLDEKEETVLGLPRQKTTYTV